MGLVLLMLLPVVVLNGGWQTLTLPSLGALALSGLVGIFVGDSALFGCMNRLGPRRSSVLFATHAFFSVLLGFAVFDERIGLQAVLGGTLVVGGVMMAVAMGAHKNESHALEVVRGSWWMGVALGLLAALCQALGSLIAKPVVAAGADPVAATLVRVASTCAAHLVLLWSGAAVARAQAPVTRSVVLRVGASGLVGMGLGMSLIMLALRHGDVGMVGILSSVSPVLVLPLLWWRLGRAPAAGAWWGAGLTVAGTVVVLAR